MNLHEELFANQKAKVRLTGVPVEYDNSNIAAHLDPYVENLQIIDEVNKKMGRFENRNKNPGL